MLKSISKKKVIVINLISIVIGLIGFAYFLNLSHNTDFINNYLVVIFTMLSFFDSVFAVASFESNFRLYQDKDKYEPKDPRYQLTVLTIVMSIIVIVATIIFELIKLL